MQNTVEGVQARFDAEQVSLFTVLLFVESMHFIFARLLLPSIAPLASAMYVLAVATVEVGVYVVDPAAAALVAGAGSSVVFPEHWLSHRRQHGAELYLRRVHRPGHCFHAEQDRGDH